MPDAHNASTHSHRPEVNELAEKIRNELQRVGTLDKIRTQLAETAFQILLNNEATAASSTMCIENTLMSDECERLDDVASPVAISLVRDFLTRRGLLATCHLLDLELKYRYHGVLSPSELSQVPHQELRNRLQLGAEGTQKTPMIDELIALRSRRKEGASSEILQRSRTILSPQSAEKIASAPHVAGNNQAKDDNGLSAIRASAKPRVGGTGASEEPRMMPAEDYTDDVIAEESMAIRGSVQFPGLTIYEEAVLTRDFLYIDIPELLPTS